MRDNPRRDPRGGRAGFTLIELMIAVCIIGVLASVALPSYQRFMNEARASEGIEAIGSLYKGAVAYWERPLSGQGLAASGAGHCVVYPPGGPAVLPPFPPTPEKRYADFAADPYFSALGFTRPDPGYFVLVAAGAVGVAFGLPTGCGSNDAEIAYGFMAACDMNGDGMVGGYALLVAAQDGQLVRRGVQDVSIFFELSGGGACPFCAPGIN